MVTRVLYAAAAAVLIGSIVFVIARGEVRCGMDEFACWETRGWIPVVEGIFWAALLAYIGRAMRGGGRRD